MLHSGSGHRAVWRCVFVCLSCWRRGEKDKRNSPKADNKCTDQCMWKQHPNNSKGMRHTQTSWRGPIAQPSPGHGWDSNRFSVRLNDRESILCYTVRKAAMKPPWCCCLCFFYAVFPQHRKLPGYSIPEIMFHGFPSLQSQHFPATSEDCETFWRQ